jgi:aryl-alcohol dehydrogenase-like predicted oxidoreductase
MNYLTLGRSGLTVSELGFGGWPMGGLSTSLGMDIGWNQPEPRDGIEAVRRAFDLGVTLFDTCSVYGDSESLLRAALQGRARGEYVLVNKVGYARGTYANAYVPANIRDQVDTSLKALGTDYIDILGYHNLYFGSNREYLEAAVDTFSCLKRAGKIRAVAVRIGHDATFLNGKRVDEPLRRYQDDLAIAELLDPDIFQLKFHLGMHALWPALDFVRDYAETRQIGLLVNKPLAQGLLLAKEQPTFFPAGDHRRRKPAFSPDAHPMLLGRLQAADVPDAARWVPLLIAYIQMKLPGSCVLVGTRNAEQASMNFTMTQGLVDADETRHLEHVAELVGDLLGSG